MQNSCLAKKGVSLVTVLIFMMIATIAATATYKWLSSTGFTSTDRMAMSEAKEASHAGLESVRSWMTYHANDVGAILRQYYDGNKKPVALTNVVRSMNTSKQVFNVWLTGVETAGSAYKFTIVSNGTARGDAKYSETAILSVRGLYKVKEPSVVVQTPVDFKQSYFGGSMFGAGDHRNTSVIINGNWEGNPTGVTEDFVVTGYAKLSGSNIHLGKHACIGGALMPENVGVTATDLYAKKSTTNFAATISGNAVFDDYVKIGQGGNGLTVMKDLTLKGSYETHENKPTIVNGNFCMESNANFIIDKLQGDGGKIDAKKNVIAKNGNVFKKYPSSNDTRERTILGGSGYSIYMPNLEDCNSRSYEGCQAGWMYQGGNLFASSANRVSIPTQSMLCDTSIVTYCDSILGPKKTGQGCDNTNYKIDDKITTAYNSFRQMVDKVNCANIQGNDQDNFDMGRLTACYKVAPASSMYHGYLVVGLHGDNNNSIFKSPSGTLDGNFIFVADNGKKLDEMKLPPTTATSNVFIYLANGVKMINTIKDDHNAHRYNYFIYSTKDIDELQHSSRGKTYHGTFYLTAASCSKIGRFNSGGITIEFNETLLQNLIDSTVICGISEEGSCGSITNNNEDDVNHEGEEMNTDAGYDRYYVANAPQLSITLESQRRNKEILYENLTSQQYTTVKPSVIILPRIAYLSNTPEGRLKDYFKLINLNGANKTYAAENVSCTPTLNKGEEERLYTNTPLSSPVYRCEYKVSDKSNIPFWLVVDAEAAKKSPVSFAGTESRIFGGGTVTVSMEVGNDQHDAVTAVVKASEIPEGWELHTSGDYVIPGELNSDGTRFYTVTLLPGMTTPVFQVKASASAESDQISFVITSTGDNARMGDNPIHSVWLNGAATIKREDIPKAGFCDNNKHKAINGVNCTEIISRPNCEEKLIFTSTGEWVNPSCADITTQNPNIQWGCGLSNADEIRLTAITRNISPYCDVFIPDSSIATLSDGQTYTLYGSYKAKLFNLKVFLDGADKSTVDVRYSQEIIKDAPADKITTKHCPAGDTCIVPIYAGYNVDVTAHDAAGESFKFWKFLHSQDNDSVTIANPKAISLRHDTTVIAQYDKLENHCFYTDFKDVKIWCDGSTNECIDKCNINKNSSCSVDGDGNYPKSNWLIPRTNNGQNYSKPQKQYSDKFIYYSAGNGNNNSSKVTYLLNRTQAGGHGTLTSRFKTCYFGGAPGNSFLNSGFMLRSSENASSYNIVQVYGRPSMHNAGKFSIDARICKGNGNGINNANSGNCQTETFQGVSINPYDIDNIVFNIDIEVVGENAVAKLSYKKDGNWKRSSVTLPLSVSANINEYVGLSLADDCFKVMNLGWESDEWDAEHCFDVPQVTCSFAANYLGGILPLNEDVKPWVGTSNYFNDPTDPDKLRPGCSIKYHYNGCDLPGEYTTNTCEKWEDNATHCGSCSADSDGPYYVSGVYANTLKNEKKDKYKFTYAGLHGTSKTYDYNGTTIYGAVRDASIVVDCSGADGNGRTYEATCGRFVVGNINECSQGTSFSLSNCSGSKSCVASISGGIANLRSSTILGEIQGLPDNDGSGDQSEVTMVLTDANGLQSQEFHISGNGTFSRDVNLMSDMQEFDPEKVVSIEFTSTSEFTIASLSSDCPNSVGISNCTAEFQGDRFVINSSITNVGGATCKTESADGAFKAEERNCPGDGKFQISAVDLQKNINLSGGSRNFAFTVTVQPKDGSEAQTCTTPSIEVLANELTCNLSSTVPVNPGEDLPSLNYQVSNCPASGCDIEARIGSAPPVRLVYNGNGQVNSWSPDITTTPGNYRYTLTYAGLSCTADITVVTGANGSTADNCAIDEANKRFTADLNLVGSTNNIKLWYFDKLGNTVGSSKSVSHSTTQFNEPLPAITEAGDYVIVLSINGEEACSVPYTYTEEEPAEEAQCYIEGDRFKTRNKNTTGSAIQVSLNRNQDGTPYGNTVKTGSWPSDGYLDIDAYVPVDPGTYTYNLWGSTLLCSVTYEVKDETEDNTEEEP